LVLFFKKEQSFLFPERKRPGRFMSSLLRLVVALALAAQLGAGATAAQPSALETAMVLCHGAAPHAPHHVVYHHVEAALAEATATALQAGAPSLPAPAWVRLASPRIQQPRAPPARAAPPFLATGPPVPG
jgi:hypothetical protein